MGRHADLLVVISGSKTALRAQLVSCVSLYLVKERFKVGRGVVGCCNSYCLIFRTLICELDNS